MELESGTRAIIALAWARRLGLADSALQDAALGAAAERLTVESDDGTVRFLRLLRGSVLCAPAWFLEASGAYDDDALAQESGLVQLVRAHGGSDGTRGIGEEALYYVDEPLDVAESDTTVVSFDPAHAHELEAACPRDDVSGIDLARRASTFTLLAEEGHAPLAGAGFDVWEGLIADVGVLTVPPLRRHGLASYIAAVAVDEALSEGYIPQWRAAVSHRAAHLTADGLGFVLTGSLTQARI
ncbi:GNAT family N-acetyltransferase [Zafaria sp. Z1313]|uniref:GNAT family N-acetyltransferase n=1 Tax=unclassified Zafaria TaxID=2828765 RepID=UPI002E76A157|nr:GNAT family N-acetyltransferase [Zafaria sp. J156]MEE1620593.1 GNAT family N-acetyltransferase [Zafaria sp. J156]